MLRVEATAHENAPSLGQEIYRAYKRGEMTQDEYFTTNAMGIAENLGDYRPIPFEPIPPGVYDYARRRIAGQTNRDASLARPMGVWIQSVIRTEELNSFTLSNLLWAIEKLKKVQLETQCNRVQAYLERFEKFALPTEDFDLAVRAQRLDALERESQERGRRA